MIKLKKLIFICFFAALFLRFYQFGQAPPGLNRDEASLGYNAYSILKTGRDEHGVKFPLTIKSFGDWKLPGYVYLLMPFIAVFGLQDWVIRLPSALAGLGTIIVIYFLGNVFALKTTNPRSPIQIRSTIGIIATLLLTTSPIHLHLSRTGYEANLALFFFSLALLLFLRSRFIISFIFFALTLYTYHAYHLFTPLFVFALLYLYRKKINRKLLASLGLFLILAVIIFYLNFSANITKASGITFMTDSVWIHNYINLPRSKITNPLLGRLIYNKVAVGAAFFLRNYLASFSPRFLVFQGGSHPIHNVPGVGPVLAAVYLLFFVGLWQLRSRLLLMWLLLTPLASSITIDAPNTVRLTPMIIPFCLIAALGWQKLLANKLLNALICVTIFVNLAVFGRQYFQILPQERAQNWGAGYQELVNYLRLRQLADRSIIMSRPNYSPYIYFLFYQQYPPDKYQQEAIRYPATEDGFFHVKSFNRYQFGEFDPLEEINQDKVVVLWADEEISPTLSTFLQKTISYQQKPIFYLFAKKQELAKQALPEKSFR